MASKRLVECQDCGYRWESSADSPRCAKSDCGRSRNVEPVADDLDDQDDADDQLEEAIDEDVDEETQPDGGGDEAGDTPSGDRDQDDDADNGSGGYTPAFETTQTRTDTDRTRPEATDQDVEDAVEDVEDDDQDDGDQEASGQQPQAAGDELPEIDPETLKPAIEATFGLAATQRGDHWEVDDEEAMKLAEGWTPVINHYAPHVFRQYTEVGAALIVTYTVLAPRLAKDKELAELEEKASEDTDASGTVREPRVEDDGIDLDVEAVDDVEQDSSPAQAAGEEAVGGYANV